MADASADADTVTDTVTDADTDTVAVADTDADAVTDTDTDTDTDAVTDAVAAPGPGPHLYNRRMRPAALSLLFLTLSLTPGCRAPAITPPPGIGTMVYVNGAAITNYHPTPALRTRRTLVDRAKYPAVDVHCHWEVEADPVAMLAAMDERNVRAAVNLSGGFGDDLDAMLERFHAVDSDRFIIFCNIDFSRIDEPDFGPAAAAAVRAAHAKGVRGLKIFKSLGLRIRDGSGRLVPVDDPRLDPLWAVCGELGMPVLIHTADPVAFFAPIDERNERWMQLKRHPDWSFHGEAFPTRDEVLAQRDRVFARHPGTIFIGAHVGNNAEDLTAAAAALDRHPNLYVDISGRVAELGRQPYTARRFFLDYQDRILFGTDRYPGRADQPRYRIYYRFLETADEHFDYHAHHFPPAGDWKINGLHLPDAVLKKIYHENFDRILP
ncbi:MAG: amidohydrolase family protein [Phycisphaerales bacterium]|nr:amidohydrolase family protein [Phycisphaerales bacterium]